MMKKNNLKQHIGYWINRLRSAIHQKFEQRIAPYDVTVAQWCIMVALYDKQAISINELARYIQVDKASISRVVERLKQQGLVIHTEAKDRRNGIVTLTQTAQDLVPQLITEAETNEHDFFDVLSNSEREQLLYLMNKIFSSTSDIQIDDCLLPRHSKDKK